MNFKDALSQLFVFEGGYSDRPEDPGGKTMIGITESVARENGYQGPIRDIPIEWVERIYRKRYWDATKCDELPESIRYTMFDSAVNSGPGQAIKWLQRALGVKDDGVIGPVTMQAIRESADLKSKILAQRLHFMTTLPIWVSFGKGWSRRIAKIMEM